MNHISYTTELLGIANSVPEGKRSEFVSRLTTRIKNPTVLLGVSIFLGTYGVDRFMLGQIPLGIIKLLTVGGFGIWTIIDWFTVGGRTRDLNIRVAREVAQSI